MSEENWIKFSIRFIVFFIIMGVLNEIVWRKLSEEAWVNFKVFGILPLTILFIVMQIPFINRNQLEN
jgi:intracellular septation protein